MSADSPVSSKPVPIQQLFFQVIILKMKNKPDVGPSIRFYPQLKFHADDIRRSIGSSLRKRPGTALAAPPESGSTRSWTSSRPRVVETLWRQLPRKRLREFLRPILVLEKIHWHQGSPSQPVQRINKKTSVKKNSVHWDSSVEDEQMLTGLHESSWVRVILIALHVILELSRLQYHMIGNDMTMIEETSYISISPKFALLQKLSTLQHGKNQKIGSVHSIIRKKHFWYIEEAFKPCCYFFVWTGIFFFQNCSEHSFLLKCANTIILKQRELGLLSHLVPRQFDEEVFCSTAGFAESVSFSGSSYGAVRLCKPPDKKKLSSSLFKWFSLVGWSERVHCDRNASRMQAISEMFAQTPASLESSHGVVSCPPQTSSLSLL